VQPRDQPAGVWERLRNVKDRFWNIREHLRNVREHFGDSHQQGKALSVLERKLPQCNPSRRALLTVFYGRRVPSQRVHDDGCINYVYIYRSVYKSEENSL
jgi:hypothetical protein